MANKTDLKLGQVVRHPTTALNPWLVIREARSNADTVGLVNFDCTSGYYALTNSLQISRYKVLGWWKETKVE